MRASCRFPLPLPLLVATLLIVIVCEPRAAMAGQPLYAFEWLPITFTGFNTTQSTLDSVPPGRADAALGFDWRRNQLILFGGSGPRDDTWLFNLTSRTWQQILPAHRPPPRFSMVYGMDQPASLARDRFVIASGERAKGSFYNDVWAFDFQTMDWVVLHAGGVYEVRYGAGGGIDPFDPKFLLISHGFSSVRYDNTFAMDLSTHEWTLVTPEHTSRPSARCLVASQVVDKHRLTIYGGCGSGGYGPCPAQDAWTLSFWNDSHPTAETSSWSKHSICAPPRERASMCISPSNPPGTTIEHLLVYGGSGHIYGNGGANDLSVLNIANGEWTLFKTVSVSGQPIPSLRKAANMAFVRQSPLQVSQGDYIIMFGGAGNEMWQLQVNYNITNVTITELTIDHINLTVASTTNSIPIETISCPYIFNLRMFHGFMMFFSWGLLLPLGATVARFGKHWPDSLWFKIHRPMQMFGLLLATGGFISAILMVPLNSFTARPHSIIGVIVMALGWWQPINAFFRPHKEPKVPPTRKRVIWEYIHKYSGRTAVVLGLINPIQGLYYVQVPTALRAVYVAYALCWFAAYVILTIMGEPETSPVAQWVSARVPWWCSKKKRQAMSS